MWLSQDVDSHDVFTTFLPDRGRFRACSMGSRVCRRQVFYPVGERLPLFQAYYGAIAGSFRCSVTLADWARNYNSLVL